MLAAIKTRLKKAEEALKSNEKGLVTVFFKDGTTRRIEPGDSIELLKESDRIIRFEDDSKAKNGILVELVNGLIINE